MQLDALDLDWFEVFKPLPHQRRLLASNAETRWLCGGRGAGKTWTLVNDSLLKALTMPRVPCALLGRVGNDLRTTIEPEASDSCSSCATRPGSSGFESEIAQGLATASSSTDREFG